MDSTLTVPGTGLEGRKPDSRWRVSGSVYSFRTKAWEEVGMVDAMVGEVVAGRGCWKTVNDVRVCSDGVGRLLNVLLRVLMESFEILKLSSFYGITLPLYALPNQALLPLQVNLVTSTSTITEAYHQTSLLFHEMK